MFGDDGKTASVQGAELEYCDIGSGEPILFIHGGMGKECSLVLHEPELVNFRRIHFQRRGYGKSSRPEKPVSLEQQSRDCQAILQFLGLPEAHVVGQSYGGAIALQLTIDAPDTVRSLTVLEPALPSILFASPDFAAKGERAGDLYGAGKERESIQAFGQAVIGEPDWDSFAAEWLDSWAQDAATIFESDMPALGPWKFGADEASRINTPVLNLLGESSPDVFRQIWEAIAEWIPQADNRIVADTSHCILQASPGNAARSIAEHATRHSAVD